METMHKIEALEAFHTIPTEVSLYHYHSNIYLLSTTTYCAVHTISFRKI